MKTNGSSKRRGAVAVSLVECRDLYFRVLPFKSTNQSDCSEDNKKERVAASLITDDVIPTRVDLYTTGGGVGGYAGPIFFFIYYSFIFLIVLGGRRWETGFTMHLILKINPSTSFLY